MTAHLPQLLIRADLCDLIIMKRGASLEPPLQLQQQQRRFLEAPGGDLIQPACTQSWRAAAREKVDIPVSV